MAYYKTGGGGQPELYNPENGQYTDEQKTHLLEQEYENLRRRFLFGLEGTYEPRYPTFGIHGADYCDFYVDHAQFDIDEVSVLDVKVNDYLLKPRIDKDKSKFFNLHGYTELNAAYLKEQIIKNSNFKEKKFSKLTKYGISMLVPTKIYSFREKQNIIILSVWLYEKDYKKMKFITVDLDKEAK